MRKMCGLKAFQLRKVSLWIYRLVVSSSCSRSHGNCQVDFLLLARKLETLSRLEPFNSMKLKWNSLHGSRHLAQVIYSDRGEKSIYRNQIWFKKIVLFYWDYFRVPFLPTHGHSEEVRNLPKTCHSSCQNSHPLRFPSISSAVISKHESQNSLQKIRCRWNLVVTPLRWLLWVGKKVSIISGISAGHPMPMEVSEWLFWLVECSRHMTQQNLSGWCGRQGTKL